MKKTLLMFINNTIFDDRYDFIIKGINFKDRSKITKLRATK